MNHDSTYSSIPAGAPDAPPRRFATRHPRDWLVALGGPLVVGAVLGALRGGLDAVQTSLALPLLLAGVTLVMLPALYIASSLIGAAPPAREVGAAVLRGFKACGVVMLGVAGPLAFLLATGSDSGVAVLLGAVATAAGTIAGLRVIFADLFGDASADRGAPLLVRAMFLGWAVVAMAIGAQMYAQFMTV